MINDLHDAMQQKRSKGAVGQILDGLAEYTVSHFADEERICAQTNYPGADEHKRHHKQLVDQVIDLQGKFASGQALATQEVITFLQDWLVNHIRAVDQKYSSHLNKHGIK